MKLTLPEFPESLPVELRNWAQEVTDLINKGLYQPEVLESRPTLSEMLEGETKIGNGTGGSGEEEIFFKPNSTEIAVIQTTTRITS